MILNTFSLYLARATYKGCHCFCLTIQPTKTVCMYPKKFSFPAKYFISSYYYQYHDEILYPISPAEETGPESSTWPESVKQQGQKVFKLQCSDGDLNPNSKIWQLVSYPLYQQLLCIDAMNLRRPQSMFHYTVCGNVLYQIMKTSCI